MTGLGGWTLHWFALDVVWRIFAGCAVGYAIGRLGAWWVFERGADEEFEEGAKDRSLSEYSTSEGLIVLGTLLLAYGAAEIVEGYGFLAVFVGAVTARQRENKSRYHKISHHFIDQIEKIVLVIVLFGFGGMLAGGVLDALTWQSAALALLLVFVFRPVSGLLAESLNGLPWRGKAAIAFLGIRGMGSIYYLAYGQNQGDFDQLDQLWAAVAFAIFVSVLVHGFTTVRFMRNIENAGAHLHVGEAEEMLGLRPPERK